MDAQRVALVVPGTAHRLGVVRHGHFGRPVLVLPGESGAAEDFASHGMVDAVGGLLDSGRLSLFCVDAPDRAWSDPTDSVEERARRHTTYQHWLDEAVLPWIEEQTRGRHEMIAVGAGSGADHAVLYGFRRPDVAPLAIGLSGNYDLATWPASGQSGERAHLADGTAYVEGLGEDHLEQLRSRLSVLLVVGQDPSETDPSGALPSTLRFARVLEDKHITHQLDVWGEDVAHEWSWWGRQLAHHLPRFC